MPIIEFTAPAPSNPYAQEVADLIAAGENHASEIFAPTATKNAARRKFAKAANAADRTAKIAVEEVVKDENGNDTDQTRFVFMLTAKHQPRNKKDNSEAASAEVAAEPVAEPEATAPVEGEAEAPAEDSAPARRKR